MDGGFGAGSPVGASSTNDNGLAKKELSAMKKHMEIRDLMIVDRHLDL